jgi:tetraacyldisaccharide 4'-kinase
MNQASLLDIISGRREGLGATMARVGLSCLEPGYGAATGLRNRLYDRGWMRSTAVSVPVISVGNLTTGGTGKTPVVAAVCHELQQHGFQPGIASRGYGSLDEAGNDERRVLDLLCPDTPHRQNRDRVEAAREVIASGANVVVLDDGFQHRRLHRDLDIVLIDAMNPWGYGRLLPRGLLRESARGLRRAGLVVMTRADLVDPPSLDSLRETIAGWTDAPLVVSRFRATHLVDSQGARFDLAEFTGRSLFGFCGIGNPAAFQRTLQEAGLDATGDRLVRFPDHHHYTAADARDILRYAQAANAEGIVCTLKDLVKWPGVAASLPVLALNISFEIITGADQWQRALKGGVLRASGALARG